MRKRRRRTAYRKPDAGPLLDRRIENEAAIVRGQRPVEPAPPYSTSIETAKTLLGILEASGERVEVEKRGDEWECTLTSKKGVITDFGDTDALAICAGFMARDLPRPTLPE